MKNLLTLLLAPIIATSVLTSAPAKAEHGHNPRDYSTTVFVGGAGDRDLANGLQSRIYPLLRADMRPANSPRQADIRVRVKMVMFEPTFQEVKRKVKGSKVKVKERLRVHYAYRVKVFEQGRQIDAFTVHDNLKTKVVYKRTHSAYAARDQWNAPGNKNGAKPHGGRKHRGNGAMFYARERAIERLEAQALNRVARRINHRLLEVRASNRYEAPDDAPPGNRRNNPRAELMNMMFQLAMP